MAKRKKLTLDQQRKLAIQRQNLLKRLAEGKLDSQVDKVAFIFSD